MASEEAPQSRHKVSGAATGKRPPWGSVALIWVVLTVVILLLDYLGVRVIDRNGLVFEVHIYWCGLTFLIAAVAFSLPLYVAGGRYLSLAAFVGGLVLAGAWWVFAFWLLMAWFHGAIGGWY